MEMNRRIRERRLALNLTQEELAHRLGMQKSAIAKYESGRVENIKRSTLAKMSEILECSPAYLMGWDDADSQIPSFDNILPIQTKRVPLLGEIACGQPIFCTEDRESYVEAGTDVRADFCLKARGDSMVGARILDGDLVFIQRDAELENGQIFAVAIDDEATLKRVYYDAKSQVLQLMAENSRYAPLIYTGETLDHVHILGKAVAFQSDVR
jgi:SOS-response transcriptional repressors (recA-mediated autopeptidases)